MAHKKGVGSTDNGRDSISKRLGVKMYGGQLAKPGNILIRQRGTKYHPGENVSMGKDHTLHALIDGTVTFTKGRKNRTFVNIMPLEGAVLVERKRKPKKKKAAPPVVEAATPKAKKKKKAAPAPEPTPAPVEEVMATPAPVVEAAPEVVEAPAPEPVVEAAPEVVEAPAEPVVEAAPEVVEAPAEPVAEAAPEVVEAPAEPVAEAAPETDIPEEVSVDLGIADEVEAPVMAAPTPAPKADAKPDKLSKIEGIGPKIAEKLNAAGFLSFRDLSNATLEQLQAVLDEAGSRYRMHDPGTWAEQAALAADGKWDELEKLQDELDGGKRV